jgi:hypothetical protein
VAAPHRAQAGGGTTRARTVPPRRPTVPPVASPALARSKAGLTARRPSTVDDEHGSAASRHRRSQRLPGPEPAEAGDSTVAQLLASKRRRS